MEEGGYMRKYKNYRLTTMLLMVFGIALLTTTYAQDTAAKMQNQSDIQANQVPVGQKMNVEGVVLSQHSTGVLMRSLGGATYNVVISDGIEVKEKKSNFLRGARKYSRKDLVTGLRVEVKGIGDSSGAIAAKEVRLRDDDFVVAQTMDTRVVPVENRLRETQARLGDTEANAQRLSGQVQELSAVSNAARGGAKAAQDTADGAVLAANHAKTLADEARAGVKTTNERITSLDDYEIRGTATVLFKAGSAVLSEEYKSELQKLAENIKTEKGYVIEIAGFASSDGDEELNRRLSRKRADAVIQFLAENYAIPLRRFVVPMGYGETQPVGDNTTRDGRKENRRVEVRVLVSKAMLPSESSSSSSLNRTETSQLQ
jgi:outer membrane protein OmpA-like peptidoglycan-associated protein